MHSEGGVLHILCIGPTLPKILLNDPDVIHGGAEIQHATIARRLAEYGWRMDVIGTGNRPPVAWEGGTLMELEDPWSSLPAVVRLWRMLRRSGATHCLVANFAPFISVLGLMCRLSGKKVILSIQHDWDVSPEHLRVKGIRRQAYLMGLRLCSVLMVQHEGQLRDARRFCRGRIEIFPNFLTVNIAPDPVPVGDCFLWIGVFRPVKRIELALDLAARVPGARFRIICQQRVGLEIPHGGANGPSFEEVVSRAASLPNVEFIPGCSHDAITRHLAEAKALLLTSDSEGWPNVVLEAASFGRPTLTFNDVADGIIQKSGIGFVAGGVDGAVQILRNTSEKEWQERGCTAWRYACDNYSNQVLTERLVRLLRSI